MQLSNDDLTRLWVLTGSTLSAMIVSSAPRDILWTWIGRQRGSTGRGNGVLRART